MAEPPLILITNDDGVHATGLRMLREAAAPLGRVVVVAPSREQSASSHAITIDRPLRHVEHSPDVHAIDGTPADCVYLALFEPRFLPRRPDLVLSGINHGLNIGTSVFYSGTIAGAREAALRGISAMAFSHDGAADGEWLVEETRVLVERMLRAQEAVSLISVNMPKERPRGARVARVSRQTYEESVIPRRDPGGREYFWIGGELVEGPEVEGSDRQAVDQGYASVTPLQLEATRADNMGLARSIAAEDESRVIASGKAS
jgi:5'-nucleotidase